jgi:hypothetical protein
MRMPSITDTMGSMSLSSPHRVLVVGCAYGGVSAVVNLLEYANGKGRQSVYPGPEFKGTKSRRGVEVTVIDERDGYCASFSLSPTSRGIVTFRSASSPLTEPCTDDGVL